MNGLRTGVQDARARPVASAFEALGKTVPTSPTPDSSPNQSSSTEDWFKKLVEALSGDKRASVPPWSGAPSGLRSWLKQLGMWEQETTTPKSRWGIKLYSALGEEARRIADVVPPETLTTEAGYAAILTTLMARYKPYLEAIGPQSVDNFVYSGDRARGETFAAFLSRKEVQKQELESQLGGEVRNPLVAGRILLRQAGLSEQQQQMIALKTHVLLSYEEVVNALRPLDRLETLSKAAALPGAVPVQRTFLQAGEDADGTEDEEEPEEEEEEYSDSELADDMLRFEDREFDEAEAIYVQAYNDVRKDLRTRKRERGFVRHRGNGGGRRSHTNKKPKGRGKGRKKDGHGRKDDSTIKGTEAELMARTRCFSCQELGHISRNCPHRGSSKGTQKKQFVTVGGTGSSTSTYMFQQLQPMPFPPPQTTLMRAVYAGVRVRAFEGVVDTAAEEAVVGSQSFNGMREELRAAGLRPVPIRRPSSQCAGIGGAARLCGAFDVPTSIAGVLGILRFTVIEDGEGPNGFVTPPLIPISYLETVGASLDLQYDTYVTADGHTTQMRRLPSGHRAIHMFDFETTPWKLPQNLQQNGHDPFLLHPRSSHSILGGGDAARDQRGEALAILTSSTSSGTLTSRTRLQADQWTTSFSRPMWKPMSCLEKFRWKTKRGEDLDQGQKPHLLQNVQIQWHQQCHTQMVRALLQMENPQKWRCCKSYLKRDQRCNNSLNNQNKHRVRDKFNDLDKHNNLVEIVVFKLFNVFEINEHKVYHQHYLYVLRVHAPRTMCPKAQTMQWFNGSCTLTNRKKIHQW